MDNSLIEQAKMFATAAHNGAGHRRKISGIPYISHPKRVADKVRHFTNILDITEYRDEMIAAAWLHDTIEDTGIEIGDLESWFPEEVVQMVHDLTEDKNVQDRDARRSLYMENLQYAPALSQLVKLADIDDNFDDIVESHENEDPKLQFKNFERFIHEKREVISILTKVNHTGIAKKILKKFDAFLALKEKQANV